MVRTREEFEEEVKKMYKIILHDSSINKSLTYNRVSLLYRMRVLELEEKIKTLEESELRYRAYDLSKEIIGCRGGYMEYIKDLESTVKKLRARGKCWNPFLYFIR
jgi:hypothetical protein